MTVDPIELEFSVACPPERAFELWARRTSQWWPREHTMSGKSGFTVAFEPRTGGRIYERTPDGEEHDWGEVLVWDPPRRLAYLWHLGTERAGATEVEVGFSAKPDTTTVVTIVHRGWERLGVDRRERNRHGWAGLLAHYVAACHSDGGSA